MANIDRRTLLYMFGRSEEHTSELQSQSNLVCRLLLEKEKKKQTSPKLSDDRKAMMSLARTSRIGRHGRARGVATAARAGSDLSRATNTYPTSSVVHAP